jgi:RNA polymerase sigma-70 factor (ECF subfamily)
LNVKQIQPMKDAENIRESRFEEAVAAFGPAMERLARSYEADLDACRDLVQEILISLWTSLEGFDGRCSMRTWVYRVAHNKAASHVNRQMRLKQRTFVGLEDLPELADKSEGEDAVNQGDALKRLYQLIERLKPLDRQVMLAYLEGMDAASTAEITGLSARNVATKIFRIKQVLAQRFQERGPRPQGGEQGVSHEQ